MNNHSFTALSSDLTIGKTEASSSWCRHLWGTAVDSRAGPSGATWPSRSSPQRRSYAGPDWWRSRGIVAAAECDWSVRPTWSGSPRLCGADGPASEGSRTLSSHPSGQLYRGMKMYLSACCIITDRNYLFQIASRMQWQCPGMFVMDMLYSAHALRCDTTPDVQMKMKG